jgi:hypothetical protein
MGRQNMLELDQDTAAGAPAPRPGGTVRDWNEVAWRAIAATQPAPLPAAQALAALHTCMYNAWAAYDDAARQTVHGVAVRLPRSGRDAASKTAAMSHAAYRVLVDRFPDGRCDADAHMSALGLDPAAPADPFSPAGIGRAQAAAMLDVLRREDAGPDARPQPFVRIPEVLSSVAEHAGMGLGPDHWYRLARHLSVRDGYDDDRDVRLFFVLANALADAAIAARADPSAAAAEALRRFTGGAMAMTAGQEPGKTIGARVFDKARRYWQGKL